MEDRSYGLDTAVYLSVLRRSWRKWLSILLVAFVCLMLVCLFLIPQAFTAKVSLSFAQSSSTPGLLATLSTGGAGTNRYIGVIRSRRLAQMVLQKLAAQPETDLRRIYDLEPDRAVKLLTDGVDVVDNVRDSLLYISVSLPGPPRLALGGAQRREMIKRAATRATNLYATTLLDYIKLNDTDREAILQREAEKQLAAARQDYENSVGRLGSYVSKRRADLDQADTGGETGESATGTGLSGATAAMSELQSYYIQRGQVEADIASEMAGSSQLETLRGGQLRSLSSLPGEDPLLTTARAEVTRAQAELDSLTLQFGREHPQVRLARERLALAQKRLKTEAESVQRGRTTQTIQSKVRLSALLARRKALDEQIAGAETKAYGRLTSTTQLAILRNDMMLSLEVLKATYSQKAILTMQSVAAKNRAVIVDYAIKPKSGAPGGLIFTVLSLLASLLLVTVWSLAAYSKVKQAQRIPFAETARV